MPAVFVAPEMDLKAFTCLHCSTLTTMHWGNVFAFMGGRQIPTEYRICICSHCNRKSIWLTSANDDSVGQLIYPGMMAAPEAHEHIPADCLVEFEEAREICERSPRGAAALLRLCLQKLLVHIGGSGEHIDKDIKYLVEKGLDPHVQQALDVIRVTGNNAVHPLEMNLEDDQDSVLVLFEMINFIVEELISRPLKTQNRFANLPEKARLAIEKRDRPRP